MIIEKTENGFYKMLDLSELPKRKRGEKEVINWKEVKKSKVSYEYNTYAGEMIKFVGELYVTYAGYDENSKQMVKVEVDSEERLLHADNFKKIRLGAFFYKTIPEHLYKFILNKQDVQYNYGSHKKIMCVCPGCKTTRKVIVNQLCRRGFNCLKCRVQESFPERFTREILRQNSIDFIQQYSAKGLPHRKFDFFLPKTKTFVEVNGEQHYKPAFGEKAFRKVKASDKEKEAYCEMHNYDFIVINASLSDTKYLLKEIKEALDLQPQNMNLLMKNVYGQENSRNMQIIEMYKQGMTTCEIGKEFKLSDVGVGNILKNHGVQMRQGGSPRRKIVCVNTRCSFPYINKAVLVTGINRKSISNNILGRTKSAGKHPVTGEPLKWMYYEDYVEKYGTEGLTEYVEDKRELL